MAQSFCAKIWGFDSSRAIQMAMVLLLILCAPWAQAQPPSGPPIDVWWSPAVAPAAEEALDQLLYQQVDIPLVHRESGQKQLAEDCFDTADLMERGFRPPHDASDAQKRLASICFARRIIAGAGIAQQSYFRAGDGTVPPLSADDLMRLPGILAPGDDCDMRAVRQLTANDWVSIAYVFHIFIAGQPRNYQERDSIVEDPDAVTPQKMLVQSDGADTLILTSSAGRVLLERLGLADINRDGIEDMIMLRTADGHAPQLAVLTKPREKSIVSLINRRDLFLDFMFACPDEAIALTTQGVGEASCD